jgi:hypothetical protein
MRFYVLTERTIAAVLWRVFRRLPTVVISVNASIPPVNHLLRRIAQRLESTRLTPLHAVFPDHHPAWDHSAPLLEDLYAKLEPRMRALFGFDEFRNLPAPYDVASCNAVTNYVGVQLSTIRAVRAIVRKYGIAPHDIGGLPVSLASLSADSSEQKSPENFGTGWPTQISNACIAVCLAGISFVRIVRYWVDPRRSVKPVDFAVDYTGDESDYALCRDIRDRKSIIFVGRKSRPGPNSLPRELSDLDVCGSNEGFLPTSLAIRSVYRAFGEIWQIWCVARRVEIRLFFRLASLPVKRINFEALFQRHPLGIFWSRDQYNVEHVIRQHVLTNAGGQQWSVFNGCLSYTYLYPQLRYLALDRFYVMTPSMFEGNIRSLWMPGMEVVGVETFRATRADYEYQSEDRPNDILFMASIWTGRREYIKAIAETAAAYPERTVYVQIKPVYRNTPFGDSFATALMESGPNIVVTGEIPYDLFRKVTISISDPSTVALEALQYGVYSFVFDIPEIQDHAFHRDIPGFCVNDGAEIVNRISSMEEGRWVYPIDEVGKLIRMDGEHFLDTVRMDMGLPRRMPSLPIWPDGINLASTSPIPVRKKASQ